MDEVLCMDKKDMKKFFIIQYIIIGLLIVLCLFLIFDRNSNDTKQNQTETTTNAYDVSMMNEVSINDVIKMFEDAKTQVLYIGRETCGVCKNVLPNLQSAQEDFGYTTQYLDITKADRDGSDWEKLEKLLDIETSINVTNADGESELKTESYGYFIGTYGYTPTLIIISKNKSRITIHHIFVEPYTAL